MALSDSSRFIIYNIYQLLIGILTVCFQNIVLVLLVELTTDEHHMSFTIIITYFYILAEIIVMVAFYISKNWLVTNFFITIFSVFILVLFMIFTPESPRWLIEFGRYEEAYEVFKKIAKFNGIKNFENNTEASLKLMHTQNYLIVCETNKLTSNNCSSLRMKWIRFREFLGPKFSFFQLASLLVCFNAVTLNYVGITIGITTLLQINPYTIYFLSSLFELFGVFVCYLNDYLGRKRALLIHLFLLILFSILVTVLPDDDKLATGIQWFLIAKTSFTLLARTMISAAFNTLLIYTAELYDVNIRNSVMAFLSSTGCISSLLSPQINSLQDLVWKPLPHLVYTCCAILTSIIIFYLPETYHQK